MNTLWPEGNVLSCALYLHPDGIEAQCGFGNEDDPLILAFLRKIPARGRRRQGCRVEMNSRAGLG